MRIPGYFATITLVFISHLGSAQIGYKASISDQQGGTVELLQSAALKDYFFKVLVASSEPDRVIGVKIYNKSTHKLFQHFAVDCQSRGTESVSVDDYNFDGREEFSVFEGSYAGANTSSLYFLYDAKSERFFESEFIGTSLSFDNKTKTITEINRCCAGSKETRSIYHIQNNKMVLVKKHCFIWDEQQQKLVERPTQECE